MDNGASSYRRYLEGDDSAFDAIIRDYFDHLLFFINRYVCDITTAEDIAIDVFSELIVHPRRYNFSVSLKTYLFMLGRSRALNHIKRRSKISFISTDEAEKELIDSLEPIAVILRDEQKSILHKAIGVLPTEMRAAIHLIYFEELSYKEAARVMKKTVKQIDNLLYGAKGKLRTALGKEGMHYYEKF